MLKYFPKIRAASLNPCADITAASLGEYVIFVILVVNRCESYYFMKAM